MIQKLDLLSMDIYTSQLSIFNSQETEILYVTNIRCGAVALAIEEQYRARDQVHESDRGLIPTHGAYSAALCPSRYSTCVWCIFLVTGQCPVPLLIKHRYD